MKPTRDDWTGEVKKTWFHASALEFVAPLPWTYFSTNECHSIITTQNNERIWNVSQTWLPVPLDAGTNNHITLLGIYCGDGNTLSQTNSNK
jgi:hypothetical protein